MAKDKSPSSDRRNLRDRAEKRVTAVEKRNIAGMSPDDIAVLIYELETHQLELEMQNEDLLRVQNEVLEMRDKYTELYDFAPVGYLTVNINGFIIQANLKLSAMLGFPGLSCSTKVLPPLSSRRIRISTINTEKRSVRRGRDKVVNCACTIHLGRFSG